MSAKRFLFILISAWHAVFASWAQSYWQLQAELSLLAPPVSLAVVNDQSAWLCDFNAQVWRTNDAGKTWRLAGTVTLEEKISCLAAVDSNIAMAGGAGAERANGSANLYRTTDGGRSWRVVYTAKGPIPYWYALHMFTAGRGIALSDPPSANENFLIAKTSDGGVLRKRRSRKNRSLGYPMLAFFMIIFTVGSALQWICIKIRATACSTQATAVKVGFSFPTS